MGFLVPQPGIEPVPLAVRAQSPNPWATREFPWISNKLPGDTDAAGLEPYFGSHLALVLDESSESLWFNVIFQLSHQSQNTGSLGDPVFSPGSGYRFS